MTRYYMFEDMINGCWVVRDRKNSRDVQSNMTEGEARSLMNWLQASATN